MKIGGENVMLAVSIAIEPEIVRVDEINNIAKATELYNAQQERVKGKRGNALTPEQVAAVSPKFYTETKEELEKLFTPPVQPKDIFRDTEITNGCIKLQFVGLKVQSYESYNRLRTK